MNDEVHRLQIEPLGAVLVVPAGQTLLQAARAAGVRLPSSCRNGTCRACLCRVSAGRARHTIEWPGLSAEEQAEGCILPCVALAETDLVLQVPGACWLAPAPGG